MIDIIIMVCLCFSHFLETQHCYAMQLGNTRVWDYVGDNFVHRLLQNNEDGWALDYILLMLLYHLKFNN